MTHERTLNQFTSEDAKALMHLAGIPYKGEPLELMNQYWPRCKNYAMIIIGSPWFSFNTPRGAVILGWRKRVLEISWYATDIREKMAGDDNDNVTSELTYCHAYTNAKAVEYLTNLSQHMNVM